MHPYMRACPSCYAYHEVVGINFGASLKFVIFVVTYFVIPLIHEVSRDEIF